MRKRLWIVLFLASVSGLVAGYLAWAYLQPQATQMMAPQPMTRVVVASRDLPAGTVLAPADMRTVDWPAASAPRGSAKSTNEVLGRGLIQPVAAEEPLLASKLAAKESGGGLSIVIPEGMRAVSVKVDDVIGVAGFVLPGTRVDVLVTMTPGREQEEATSKIILQNVEALAAGQTTTRDAQGTPQSVPVITLLVTPEESEKLTLAATKGRIQLALRNMVDTAAVQTPGVKAATLLRESSPVTASPQPVRRRPVATASRPQGQSVVTYKGSQRTVETFTNN